VPFIAEDRTTGERVDINDYSDPKSQLIKGDLLCPFCKSTMIINDGLIRRAYFSHKGACPLDDYARHPESLEHLYLKKYIADTVGKEFESYVNSVAHFEYIIEEAKRIADIVFEFPNGWLIAHEIQLSAITTGELQQRTEDYRNAGVDVIWWLGKSADTETNREWMYDNFSECFTVDYDRTLEVLRG